MQNILTLVVVSDLYDININEIYSSMEIYIYTDIIRPKVRLLGIIKIFRADLLKYLYR